MTRASGSASLIALVTLCLGFVTAVGAQPAPEQADTSGNECCFTNPRYTGVCQVTPGPDETCADVLAYLNNQASVGKTYCGNTKVRGGWAQVDCDASKASCNLPPEQLTTPAG